MIYRHGAPFEMRFSDDYEAISLRMTHDVMEEAQLDLTARPHPFKLIPNTPSCRLSRAMLQELAQCLDETRRPSDEGLIAATLDVLACALGKESGLPRERDLQKKLRLHLVSHAAEGDLTLEKTAKVADMSPRSLTRAFAGLGLSPMRWLRLERLKLARDAM